MLVLTFSETIFSIVSCIRSCFLAASSPCSFSPKSHSLDVECSWHQYLMPASSILMARRMEAFLCTVIFAKALIASMIDCLHFLCASESIGAILAMMAIVGRTILPVSACMAMSTSSLLIASCGSLAWMYLSSLGGLRIPRLGSGFCSRIFLYASFEILPLLGTSGNNSNISSGTSAPSSKDSSKTASESTSDESDVGEVRPP